MKKQNTMKNKSTPFIAIILLYLISPCYLKSQTAVQSSQITIEIKAVNTNDVAINGSSKQAKMNIDMFTNTSTMILDPSTILSDNIEFNEAMKLSEMDDFIINITFDPQELYTNLNNQELKNVTCLATINNITEKIPTKLITSVKIVDENQAILILGFGEIPLKVFGLDKSFPFLKDEIKFRFTQNLTAASR